ncbi:hypothetical protein [Streptomyces sp. NEAU-W12]|uniref:hypothetical protein n=1 Tax=Streptomyces sp. NEAU-W12 TaxID=2994668 RepID=UPI00224A725E|nr:hypothetical protein [Streptomyces sp. NEAU-W12]MCX2926655.1 hypothetical protein [Streptomyces sp. NEAU-W12]
MTAALRTALTAARARHAARHPTGVRFRDTCARVSGSAARAEEFRQHIQLTAFTRAH